jgi:hypothetical protein
MLLDVWLLEAGDITNALQWVSWLACTTSTSRR